MKDARKIDPTKLLFGPYIAPLVRRGDRIFCEIRGTVKVGGYTSALIPWPRILKTGRASLILCGDLVRAVRTESELAVAHHWDVCVVTVWSWRKALHVGRINPGTERLYQDYYPKKLPDSVAAIGRQKASDPDVIDRIRQSKVGKPAHPATAAALRKAAKRRKLKSHRRAIGKAIHNRNFSIWVANRTPHWPELERDALHARRLAPTPSRGRWWLKEEEALLGNAPDSVVASVLGRSFASVRKHRHEKQIPIWSPK
jgi:hypothetical protein